MIKILSTWAKSLGLTIIIVSILEMLLPDNNTKKYIRIIFGLYILFTIISPFINNKDKFNFNNINIDTYSSVDVNKNEINQKTMDERIEELYKEQLEKDIISKLEEKGYRVSKCKVDANIKDSKEDSKITKIELKINKNKNDKNEKNTNEETNSIEDKLVQKIQKIKPINSSDDKVNEEDEEKIDYLDKQTIKDFLTKEYGVDEKCLKIN